MSKNRMAAAASGEGARGFLTAWLRSEAAGVAAAMSNWSLFVAVDAAVFGRGTLRSSADAPSEWNKKKKKKKKLASCKSRRGRRRNGHQWVIPIRSFQVSPPRFSEVQN